MTTLVQGVITSDCNGSQHYIYSDNLACSGLVTANLTIASQVVTISEGEINAMVTHPDGTDFVVKVNVIAPETVNVNAGDNIYVVVKQAGIDNPANNSDVSDMAYFYAGTSAPESYATIIGTVDSSLNVIATNSGHYLPGCDFCMKCEDGALQLPTTNVQGGLTSTSLTTGNINSSGTVTATTFIGDGSQLSGLAGTDPATYDDAGITEYATLQEMLDCEDNLSVTPKVLCEYLGCQGATAGTSFPIQAAADSEKNMSTIDGTFYKVKEIQIGYLPSGGSVSVSYQIRKNQSAGSIGFVNGSIRINGVEISKPINPSNISTANSYEPVGGPLYTFLPGSDLDFPVQSGDTIELWVAGDPGNSIDSIDTKEFRIYYECANLPRFPTVIID